MRIATICTALVAPLLLTACTSIVCGDGTIERNGTCEPADVTTNAGMCGSGTKLEGDQCVSTIQCDPATTMQVTDPMTGETKCVPFANNCMTCSAPSDVSKQTICGQIYDFENDQPFMAAGATGVRCPATPTATGPCALAITAFDALQFASNPSTAQPLVVDDMCIDDMGRFALKGITTPGGPLIGLGIDDAAGNMGPAGVTNSVGIAVSKLGGSALPGVEHYIVRPATTTAWANSGGPPISGGIFVGLFRAHACPGGVCNGNPDAPQAGTSFIKPHGTAYYFQATQTTRMTIDVVATATGANGTGLLTGVAVNDGAVYSGTGGITDTAHCTWDTHPAAALPNIVLVQTFHKIGTMCTD